MLLQSGMASPLNTQMVDCIPFCQPPGDGIMFSSPGGWLTFVLRVQQADHGAGVVGAILPAPGRL